MRTAEKGNGGGGVPPANSFPPLPHSQEVPCWGELEEDKAAAPLARPEKWGRQEGHSPLLIFMSQEKVLHLLPSEVELVVIVAFDCLSLIHRVIQGQEEFFEGLHYRWWHTQVNLCNAAQPGGGGVQTRRLGCEGEVEPR